MLELALLEPLPELLLPPEELLSKIEHAEAILPNAIRLMAAAVVPIVLMRLNECFILTPPVRIS